jgi:hypothetical protein
MASSATPGFPPLEEEPGQLTRKDRHFVRVVGLLRLEPFLEPYRWGGIGCPPKCRAGIVHAFIAKAVYQALTTPVLLEWLATRPTLRRLCGWENPGDLPSESTFSRAFAAFSRRELPQKLHEAIVKEHLASKRVGHVSRSATTEFDFHEIPFGFRSRNGLLNLSVIEREQESTNNLDNLREARRTTFSG